MLQSARGVKANENNKYKSKKSVRKFIRKYRKTFRFGFAKGGITEGGLTPLSTSVISAADGGIFKSPTLALIGDNPERQEAVIPMKGGKVPVELRGDTNNGGSQIYIKELSIMQGATIDEALTNKSMDFWINLVKQKILPSINELGSNGATTTLRLREAY